MIYSFKAVTEINATPKKTLEYFIPGPNRVRMQWDDTIKVSLTTYLHAVVILHI